MDGSQDILNFGYRFYVNETLLNSNDEFINVKTWKTEKASIGLAVENNYITTRPKGSSKRIEYSTDLPEFIEGPITKGQLIGNLVIQLDGESLNTIPLVALENNPNGSLIKQIQDTIQLWFE